MQSLRFALSGGIVIGIAYALVTIASLLQLPGYRSFAKLLQEGYGFYGYSISWIGVLVGALWGFVEGFIWFGIFVWI